MKIKIIVALIYLTAIVNGAWWAIAAQPVILGIGVAFAALDIDIQPLLDIKFMGLKKSKYNSGRRSKNFDPYAIDDDDEERDDMDRGEGEEGENESEQGYQNYSDLELNESYKDFLREEIEKSNEKLQKYREEDIIREKETKDLASKYMRKPNFSADIATERDLKVKVEDI